MLKRVHTFSSNKVFLITIILFTLTYSVYYFFTLKIWEKREVFVSDQFLYYSYLPAYFIENDLTFNFIDNKIDNHYHYQLFIIQKTNNKSFYYSQIELYILYET